jgi:hypothetical protein
MSCDHDFIYLSITKTGVALKDAVAARFRREVVRFTDPETGVPSIFRWESSPWVAPRGNPSTWTVRNVMLVGWEGDVAFRIAVGQVIASAWCHGRPRLVYLGLELIGRSLSSRW